MLYMLVLMCLECSGPNTLIVQEYGWLSHHVCLHDADSLTKKYGLQFMCIKRKDV